MHKRWAIRICAAAMGLGGCAAAPEAIPPSYVSPIGYAALTCDQLSVEGYRLREALATASARQDQAHTNDVVGVFLVGLPVGSMVGQDVAYEVARLKGEREALFRAAVEKKCPGV